MVARGVKEIWETVVRLLLSRDSHSSLVWPAQGSSLVTLSIKHHTSHHGVPSYHIPWHHHHTYHDTIIIPWHHDTMAPSYNHTYTMTLWHLDTIKSYSYDRRRDCKLSVKIIVICTLLSLLCVCSFHLKISICSQTAHHDGDMMRSEIHLTWLK